MTIETAAVLVMAVLVMAVLFGASLILPRVLPVKADVLSMALKSEREARAEAERIRAAQEEMDARLNKQRILLDEADRRIARLRQALQETETYVIECIQVMQRAGVTPPTRRYSQDPPGRTRAHSLAEFIAEYFTDDDLTLMFADFRVPEYDAPQASTLIRAHKFTVATRRAQEKVREYLAGKRPNLIDELQEVI